MTLVRKWSSISTFLALLATLSAGGAMAGGLNVAGVALDENAQLDGMPLRLNGAGVRKFLGLRVYVASLYLPAAVRAAGEVLRGDVPKRLQVSLLRDTTTEQNLDALREGMEDNNDPAEMEALEPEITRFLDLVRQVSEVPAGTVIQLDYLPREGTRVRFGERHLGSIPGARFNRALLRIWLGEKPIQLSLKQSLLGMDGPSL